MRPRRAMCIGDMECIRTCAETLTRLELNTSAIDAEIPPLYDAQPYETAIQKGHGEFAFTVDNGVLYFIDRQQDDGSVHTLSS